MSGSFAFVFALLTIIGLATFALFEGWTPRRAVSMASISLSAAVATFVAIGTIAPDLRIVSTGLAMIGVVFNIIAYAHRDPLPRPVWLKSRR